MISAADNTLGALVAATFTAMTSTPAVIAATNQMTYDLAEKGALAVTAYIALLGAAATAGFVRDAYKAFRYERQS